MKSQNTNRGSNMGVHIAPGVIGPNPPEFKGQPLAFFKIHVNADAVISFKDVYGIQINNMNVSKGKVEYPMSVIIACNQAFYIIHDGTIATTARDMTGPVYPSLNVKGYVE